MGPVEQLSPTELSIDLTANRGRPRIRIEGAVTREEFLFRLVSDDSVLFWVSVDDWWEDYVYVRPKVESWTSPLAPIRADDVRAGRNWLWRFAGSLVSSERGPLYASKFRFTETTCLRRGDEASHRGDLPAPPHLRGYAEAQQQFWNEHFASGAPLLPGGIAPLRRLNADDEGRLKWWRKVARAGELPPVLLWYVEVLEKHVVLDGHVRLEAALHEDVQVRVVQLWQENPLPPKSDRDREALERGLAQMLALQPAAVPKANELLQEAYGGRVEAAQRGWPIPGGPSTWVTGMRENLPDVSTLPEWVPEWIRRLEKQQSQRSKSALSG